VREPCSRFSFGHSFSLAQMSSHRLFRPQLFSTTVKPRPHHKICMDRRSPIGTRVNTSSRTAKPKSPTTAFVLNALWEGWLGNHPRVSSRSVARLARRGGDLLLSDATHPPTVISNGASRRFFFYVRSCAPFASRTVFRGKRVGLRRENSAPSHASGDGNGHPADLC
jgi:hypothetical protein